MKKLIYFLLLVLLTFAGCDNKQSCSDNTEISESSAPSDINIETLHKVLDPYYNQYNTFSATDGEYIFFCSNEGVCKLPVGGNNAQLIQPCMETIMGIALHDSVIYYIDGFNLCRVDKDGGNQTIVTAAPNPDVEGTDMPFLDLQHIAQILCLEDTLYINTDSAYFSVNIESNPDYFETYEIEYGFPNNKGIVYQALESSDLMDNRYSLYMILPNQDERILIANGISSRYDYIVTDKYIFYITEEDISNEVIYRCDLDGQNAEKICKTEDTNSFKFLNYDEQWIYCSDKQKEGSFFVFRVNQETAEKEVYEEWEPTRFDVIDNHLYAPLGYQIRINVDGGAIENYPFNE